MTPYKAACDLIRPYVLRGDSLESIQKSHISSHRPPYLWMPAISVQIGFYFSPNAKTTVKLKPDEIGAAVGKEWKVFKLSKIYDDIKNGVDWENEKGKALKCYD